MRRGTAAGAVALAGLVLAAAGDRGGAADAPAGGAVPAGFRSYVAVDDRFAPGDPRNRKDKLHDFVVEAGLNPTVAVFTRAAPADDGAAARLARALDPVVQKYRGRDLSAFVVFLTLDKEFPQDDRRTPEGVFLRDAEVDKVRTLAGQLKTPRVPFGLAAGKSPAVDAWGVTDQDEAVAVLYNRMRVVKRWEAKAGYTFGDDKVKEVVAETERVAGGK